MYTPKYRSLAPKGHWGWRVVGLEEKLHNMNKLLADQQEGLEINEDGVWLWSLRGVGQSMENCSLVKCLQRHEENKLPSSRRRCSSCFKKTQSRTTLQLFLMLSAWPSFCLPPAWCNWLDKISLCDVNLQVFFLAGTLLEICFCLFFIALTDIWCKV